MLHTVVIWLLFAALAGAGAVNLINGAATRSNFIRWGFPSWWGRVTGGLEIIAAGLVASPPSREAGLILGAAIIAAAALTVLRNRDFSHLAPLGVFTVLLATAQFTV